MNYKKHHTIRNTQSQELNLSDLSNLQNNSARKYGKSKREQVYRNPNPILAPEVAQDVATYIINLPKTHRELLRFLTGLYARRKHLYPSQSFMAKWLGVCRETVNRALQDLIAAGLIGSWYRHLRSSYYNLSSIFFDPSVIIKLSGILSLSLLFTISQIVSAAIPGCQNKLYYGIIYHKVTQLYLDKAAIYKLLEKQRSNTLQFETLPAIFKKEEAVVYKVKQSVEKLLSLSLSSAGKIRLSAFPDEAILAADQQMQQLSLERKRQIRQPFGLFFKMASDYCKAHHLAINWDITAGLAGQMSLSADAEPLTSSVITHISTNPAGYEAATTNINTQFSEDQQFPADIKYPASRKVLKQEQIKRSLTMKEMVDHNRVLAQSMQRSSVSVDSRLQKETHADKLRAMDTETATRVMTTAERFRAMLGITEEGTPIDPEQKPTIKKLVGLMR